MKLDCKDSLVNLLNRLAQKSPKMLKRGEPKFDALSLWLGQELADGVRGRP